MVEHGTYMMLIAIEIAVWAHEHGVIFSIENPATSMCWLFEPMRKLMAQGDIFFITLDYCQFGEAWRKSTSMLTNCRELRKLAKRCHGSHANCSATGKKHITLRGTVPQGYAGY